MAEDAYKIMDHIRNGRRDKAVKLGQNRIKAIEDRGGNSESTTDIVRLIQQNRPETDIQAMGELGSVVEYGRDQGWLPKEEFVEYDKERGGVITRGPGGKYKFDQVAGEMPMEPIKFSDFRGVNKDVGALVKNGQKIRTAASRLKDLSETKTATDQLAAVFVFMKALDPDSVVREGEQAQARATGGLADHMIAYVNKLQGEGALSKNVFDQMVQTAMQLSNTVTGELEQEVGSYLTPYGKRLNEKQRGTLMGRIPKRFEMPEAKAPGREATISTQAEFDALPSGTWYTDSETGKRARKP